MGQTPAVDEIKNQEQRTENNSDDTGSDGSSGGGMFGGGMPSFGLTRGQLLVIAVIVVAVIAWKARDSGSSGSNAEEEIEKAKNPDLSDVTVREDDDNDEVEIVLPTNPDNELEKDEAIINHFKDAGIIEGGDD